MIPSQYSIRNLPLDHSLAQLGRQHIQESVFVSPRRKRKLLKHYHRCWQCQNPYEIDFCLFLPQNDDPTNWREVILITLWRLRFMRRLAKNKKSMRIWIWPTPWKKTIPRNAVFTEDHVNSGSTTTYLSGPRSKENGEICIWRTEELPKVVVHEAIHALHMDRGDPKPAEAYTELKAVLAHLYLELLERRLPLTMRPKLLAIEQTFGMRQARKCRLRKPGSTNVYYYLDERNRLLCHLSKKQWAEQFDQRTPLPAFPLPSTSLRFTISDILLDQEGFHRIFPDKK